MLWEVITDWFILIMNKIKLQVKIIEAQFFQQPISTYFNLSIITGKYQFNTPSFIPKDKKIDLSSCTSIQLPYNHYEKTTIKILINGYDPSNNFFTEIQSNSLLKFSKDIQHGVKKRKRYLLDFPLFQKIHILKGGLKIQVQFIQLYLKEADIKRKQNMFEQRKIISSQQFSCNFQPVYSRLIKVSISQERIQQKQLDIKKFNYHDIQKRTDQFEPFKEQISQIQIRDSCDQRLIQQEDRDMVQLAKSQLNPNLKIENQRDCQIQNMQEIPEECYYLFQKINQINKRYAPLQKIPSQQQFSDYSQLNEGDIKNQTSIYSNQMLKPLEQITDYLEELNLLKFAQGLQSQKSNMIK